MASISDELKGRIAYRLTTKLVIDMPTARAAVDEACKELEKPVKPVKLPRGVEDPRPKCRSCGTTKNVRKDGWYGYRCDSDGCVPF